MNPTDQHVAVLGQLADVRSHLNTLGDAMRHQVAGLDGRRRILERHAPNLELGARVTYCGYARCFDNLDEWPCDDYRDAAAGLTDWPDA